MIAAQHLQNRMLPSDTLTFFNRQQLATELGCSVGRIERLMARGALHADAFDHKRAPLFASTRLPEITNLLHSLRNE